MYGCMKWSEVDVSLNHDVMAVFSTPQENLNSQNSGKLGLCNGVRVQPYALETAYQCLKHWYMSNMDV